MSRPIRNSKATEYVREKQKPKFKNEWFFCDKTFRWKKIKKEVDDDLPPVYKTDWNELITKDN